MFENLTKPELIALLEQKEADDKIIVESLQQLFTKLNISINEEGKFEMPGLIAKITGILMKAQLPNNSLEKEFGFLKPLLDIVDKKIKQSS